MNNHYSRILAKLGAFCILPVSLIFWSTPLTSGPYQTPTPTPSCMMAGGKIESAVISSDIARKLVDIRVYTPPCYNPAAGKEYPVLYLLHGQSSREDQWDLLGVDEAASDLIRAGKIEPLIIVMPREINYLDDPSNSNFGDLILSEVIPWAEKNYAIHPDSGMHAIGGLSRGGSWALRLGLSNPDLFGSVAGHSPVPFTADLYQVSNWRVKTAEEQLPYIYLDIGLLDPYKDIARRYELRISEVAYPHEWHMNEGTHNSEYWSGNVKDYLIWYNNGWRLTQGGE